MITSGDMQRAIWYFLENEAFDSHFLGPWSTIGTNAVICAVEANGAGFMPGCGEYILFIAIPKEGDVLKFKVIGQDPKTKKFKLSRKVLLPKPEAPAQAE